MGSKRTTPVKSLAEQQVASTDEMARLAGESGYKNVEMNLKNLADRRRTAAKKKKATNAV